MLLGFWWLLKHVILSLSDLNLNLPAILGKCEFDASISILADEFDNQQGLLLELQSLVDTKRVKKIEANEDAF